MLFKSADHQKAHLRPILDLRNKFQLHCPIWRRVMREINSKNILKKQPKITLLEQSSQAHLGFLLILHNQISPS